MKLIKQTKRAERNKKAELSHVRLAKAQLILEKIELENRSTNWFPDYFVDLHESYHIIPWELRNQIYSQARNFNNQVGSSAKEADWVQFKKFFLQISKDYKFFQKELRSLESPIDSTNKRLVATRSKKNPYLDYNYRQPELEPSYDELTRLKILVKKYKSKLDSPSAAKRPGVVSRIRTFLRYFLLVELIKQFKKNISDSIFFKLLSLPISIDFR